MVEKNKSVKIPSQFPDFFDFEQSQLVKFIKYYYEWLESMGPDFYSRRILDYNDIDFKKDGYSAFDKFLHDEFMKGIPENLIVDNRFLIKHIKDFYRAKGTEDSIRLLFRILYGEDVSFDYPGKYILRASDGKWVIEKSLKCNLLDVNLDVANTANFDSVVGVTSGASARIDRIETKLENEVTIYEIFITNQNGTFANTEILKSKLTNNQIFRIVPDGIIVYPGKYLNTDGFLSSDKVLEDNFYYQEFSYVIKSGKTVSEYGEALQNLTHPAGTKFFGSYLLEINIDISNFLDVELEEFYSKTFTYDTDFSSFISANDTVEIVKFSPVLEIDIPQLYNIDDWSTTYTKIDNVAGRNYSLATSGDILEFYSPSTGKITYREIDHVISADEVVLKYDYPFRDTSTGLQVKLHKKEDQKPIDVRIFANSGEETINKNLNISDLSNYTLLMDETLSSIGDLLLSDTSKNKFVYTDTDYSDVDVVGTSILSIDEYGASSVTSIKTITPSANNLPEIPMGIYVGDGGDVAVVAENDSTPVIFYNVGNGHLLPIKIKSVNSVGTTANNIIGFYGYYTSQSMTLIDSLAIVTPSANNLPNGISIGLYVGLGGDLTVVAENDTNPVTIKNIPDGSFIPIKTKSVRSANTTADGIIALYGTESNKSNLVKSLLAVTPSANDLTSNTSGVYVGTGGNISIIAENDTNPVVLYNVPNCTFLPIKAKAISNVDTTATDIVALYDSSTTSNLIVSLREPSANNFTSNNLVGYYVGSNGNVEFNEGLYFKNVSAGTFLPVTIKIDPTLSANTTSNNIVAFYTSNQNPLQIESGVALTSSIDNVLEEENIGLFVGSSGTLNIIAQDDTTPTNVKVDLNGVLLPIKTQKVLAEGTTANNIIALYGINNNNSLYFVSALRKNNILQLRDEYPYGSANTAIFKVFNI